MNDNHPGVCLLGKYELLDTSTLLVEYDVEALDDSLQNRKRRDIAILQVGNSWTKFFGQTRWRLDNNYTLQQSGKQQTAYDDLRETIIDFTIFRKRNTDKMICLMRLPFIDNSQIVYEEPVPALEWNITPSTKEIAGYTCLQATTVYGGRLWDVWFTASIPINGGLWKFSGLPGLILEATDSQNHYRFTVRKITPGISQIRRYEIPSKTMAPDDARIFIRRFYERPIDFFDSDEGFILFNKERNSMELLDESWTIPYNPLELN